MGSCSTVPSTRAVQARVQQISHVLDQEPIKQRKECVIPHSRVGGTATPNTEVV